MWINIAIWVVIFFGLATIAAVIVCFVKYLRKIRNAVKAQRATEIELQDYCIGCDEIRPYNWMAFTGTQYLCCICRGLGDPVALRFLENSSTDDEQPQNWGGEQCIATYNAHGQCIAIYNAHGQTGHWEWTGMGREWVLEYE